ncbi:KpsF/GutQ family sugar-phosphate isomerase [Olivibacter domesticus]|uniref:Arabinose-5-phosphate isomerase n=1 Tax=Olivibacter domesticus TaxID=407022 RepID=A0A1H7HVQ2_OLID1|nr:KpsF/GutQ family sugar-phosphate isomerase [Olivibacter domesticus]SEK54443.1 arabinose-5-phosphate isomerase [Olivibacter domesticus]
MKTKSDIENIAINALKLEAEAITNLTKNINDEFINAVFAILDIKGRVIITGIGKSAIIAQKIVATMNSTGTPAIFMHAADAIHGDLGMIQQDDIVIAISKSGDTPEIKVLVPLLKNSSAKIVAMVGNTKSFLAEQADFILDTTVTREACPLNLAPTTSTTAQLAMGDALAICLLECRSFTNDDFAKYHPGGALGKRLYLKVEDLASHNTKPQVSSTTGIKEVLVEITKNRLGAVAVVDNSKIAGIITDGDIRRMLEQHQRIEQLRASDIMGKKPKVIDYKELAVHALDMMRNNNITQLLAVKEGAYFGIIHLHDLLKEGII